MGYVPAKKNRYRFGRQGRLYLDPDVVAFMNDALIQIKKQTDSQFGDKPVWVEILFKCKDRFKSRDLDGMTTTIYDILQGGTKIKSGWRVINDDKQIIASKQKKVKANEEITKITIKEYKQNDKDDGSVGQLRSILGENTDDQA